MTQFDYIFDEDNLEIFPKEIWENPYVVFHGTSEFHSSNIEKNGLIKATSPFDIKEAEELLRVLNLPQVSQFDQPKTFLNLTVRNTLASYVFGIQNNDFRLSFAYLSYLCVFFSTGKLIGGQTFGNIREAQIILKKAIAYYPEISSQLTEPIIRLFKLGDEIAKTNGVVYAIKLKPPFTGIMEEYGTIHSEFSIDKDSIIGKVILPSNIDTLGIDIALVKKRNQSKLIKNGHLGIILERLKYQD